MIGLADILLEGEVRNGLLGGNRKNGGASNVDNNSRDNANENWAVRLVLSRKQSISKELYICRVRTGGWDKRGHIFFLHLFTIGGAFAKANTTKHAVPKKPSTI